MGAEVAEAPGVPEAEVAEAPGVPEAEVAEAPGVPEAEVAEAPGVPKAEAPGEGEAEGEAEEEVEEAGGEVGGVTAGKGVSVRAAPTTSPGVAVPGKTMFGDVSRVISFGAVGACPDAEGTSSLVISPGLAGQTTFLPTVVSSVAASV